MSSWIDLTVGKLLEATDRLSACSCELAYGESLGDRWTGEYI